MVKRFWLLVLVLVSVGIVGSQEVKHAPTVEQCRADQRLWLSKLEQVNDKPDPIWPVSFKELMKWVKVTISRMFAVFRITNSRLALASDKPETLSGWRHTSNRDSPRGRCRSARIHVLDMASMIFQLPA